MMMQLKYIFVIIYLSFCGQHVAAQNITKCNLGNSTCEEANYLTVVNNVISKGSPSLGIPSMNPLALVDKPVFFLGNMVQATLNDGDCFGMGTCSLLYFITNVTTFRKTARIQCGRIAIQGTYTIKTNSLFALFFGDVSGTGNMSIVADDWYFDLYYPFKFIKHDNGEIYTKADFAAGTYVSKVLANFRAEFDSILVNGHDYTELILSLINSNWKIFLETIGKPFHDVSLGEYFETHQKYFNGVPATSSYIDDLTPYLSTS